MRILIWCPHLNMGGGARLLSQLAPALARRPEVEFVKLAVPSRVAAGIASGASDSGRLHTYKLTQERESAAPRRWLRREGRILGVRGTGRVKDAAGRLLFGDVKIERRAWEAEQLREASRDCDVVYAFWTHLQTFHDTGKPLVCTFQDTTLIDFPEILGWQGRQAEHARSAEWLGASAQVVVSSAATRRNLIRLFGARYESAIVIPHAILPTGYSTDAPISPALAGRLPARYIVFPANISAHKNHYTLFVAWSRFARRRDAPLVLFGQGTELLTNKIDAGYVMSDRLRGIVERVGLRPDADFRALGYVDDADVLPLIKSADALIMPTLAEGGGSYPVEEALSVGTPVLCSDIPVMREHLAGRTARIAWFDPESADSVLRALDDLFDHYDDYKHSALNAVGDPRYTWDDIAAQYVEVFRRATGGAQA
jgi:glycosyltransferase involved in cell wall biosynthesis